MFRAFQGALLAAAVTTTAAPDRPSPPTVPRGTDELHCAGLRRYPKGSRFKIEAGQHVGGASDPKEHRFVVFEGVVGLIYFVLHGELIGQMHGEATSFDTITWEHETSAVTCELRAGP